MATLSCSLSTGNLYGHHAPIQHPPNSLSAPIHPADYDFSNTVDINDIHTYIADFTKKNLAADHNGDAQLDFYDIAAFLKDYRLATAP